MVGINDRKYPTARGGKLTIEYTLWRNMIEHCYGESCKSKHATYTNCITSENFKSYSFFYEWCQKQTGFGEVDDKGNAWQLDKDILVKGNKTYSEDTCVFVPQRVNKLLTKRDYFRGGCIIGVSFHKRVGKYYSQCSTTEKNTDHIGYFDTEKEAFQAYKLAKEVLVKNVAELYKPKIDIRVYTALIAYEVDIND